MPEWSFVVSLLTILLAFLLSREKNFLFYQAETKPIQPYGLHFGSHFLSKELNESGWAGGGDWGNSSKAYRVWCF